MALCAALVSSCVGSAESGDVDAPGFNAGLDEVRDPSGAQGGALRVVIGEVDSFDPARSYHAGVWNIMRLYVRQLVTYAPAPGDRGTRLVPDLATGLGTPGDGGRTWTYTLKPDLKFEDGTPITSKDVKYGVERLFASDTITGGPTWPVTLLDDPESSYMGPYLDETEDKLGLAGVETPDDRTIVFRLNRPFADWDYVMALPATSPVPRDKDTGADYGIRPVASGPYKFGSVTENQVTLVRNEQWARQSDTVRRALPDTIEITTGLSSEERDRRILEGDADVDVTGSGLGPEAAAEVLADADRKSRTDNPTTGSVRLIAMPVTVPPFDNVHCRRAIQYALDKAAVRAALGGPYSAALATTLWPRGLPGYPATAAYPSGEGNHGDLDAAREELTNCGHPDGFQTTIASVDGGRSLATAEVVQEALGRVGIDTDLLTFPEETFLVSDVGSQRSVASKGIGLIVSSWTADFTSPSAFYLPLTDGRRIRSPGNTNLAELNANPLRQAANQANATTRRGTAIALWHGYAAGVMETATYAPVVEDRVLLLGSERLRNVYVHRAFGGYDLVSLGVA